MEHSIAQAVVLQTEIAIKQLNISRILDSHIRTCCYVACIQFAHSTTIGMCRYLCVQNAAHANTQKYMQQKNHEHTYSKTLNSLIWMRLPKQFNSYKLYFIHLSLSAHISNFKSHFTNSSQFGKTNFQKTKQVKLSIIK